MKNYILTATIRIDDGDIEMAKAWEKRTRHDYRGDTAHMVFDAMTSGEKIPFEIREIEMNEEK